MTQCPKCGYERQPDDEIRFSHEECPRCGIIYTKFEERRISKESEQNKKATSPECHRMDQDPEILDIPLQSSGDQTPFPDEGKTFSLLKRYPAISRFVSAVKDSRVVHLFNTYCDLIALLLLAVWVGGAGYWFYRFVMADINPQPGWRLLAIETPKNPKDAMALLFFGAIVGIFVSLVFFFVIKFACNMVWGTIAGIFPKRYYFLVRSIALLLALYISFSYIQRIKKAGYSAYYQAREFVQIARQNKVIIHVDAPVHGGILDD